jgi:hypothetical protein
VKVNEMKKKIFLILIIFVMAIYVYGDVSVGCAHNEIIVNINKLDIEYCEIALSKRPFSKRLKVEIDAGNGLGFIVDLSNKKSTTPKKLRFTSRVQVLNYMKKNNWELVSSSVSHVPGNYSDFYYIFKKKS